MNSNSSLFQETRDEVMTPILPADVNGPSAQAAVNAGRSVDNDSKPQGPQPQGLSALTAANDGPSQEDKQMLHNDSMGVGQTLQAKGSDASYLGGQAAKMSVEVGSKALSLTTAAITGLFDSLRDKGEDGPDGNGPELEDKPRAPAPAQNFQPSATSGPSMGG